MSKYTQNRPTKLFDGIENTCITTPPTCYDNDTTNDLEIKTLDLKARFEEAELQQALRDLETKRHQIQVIIMTTLYSSLLKNNQKSIFCNDNATIINFFKYFF